MFDPTIVDPSFFPGRAATIYYRAPSPPKSLAAKAVAAVTGPRDEEIGVLGILHRTVLQKFEISYPCSVLEFNLAPFEK